MRVGVIDVGSNTVRLLVAGRSDDGGVLPLAEERAQLGLGEEIERYGRIRRSKLSEAADWAHSYAHAARASGAAVVETVVTAPGRQSSNAGELVAVLQTATGVPVRVLSSDEEGALAHRGAAAGFDDAGRIAVCDVGGGSSELAVGMAGRSVEWLRSYDVGSLRLTTRAFGNDRPTPRTVRTARKMVREELAGELPPGVEMALAAGGTARAVRRIVGRSLGPEELDDAVDRAVRLSPGALRRRYGIEAERARTLAAGAIILAEIARMVEVPFEVARGGLREGVAAGLLEQLLEPAA